MPTKLSQLPMDENKLIDFLEKHGPQIIDGKEWYLENSGWPHCRSIPVLNGTELGFAMKLPQIRFIVWWQNPKRVVAKERR